MILSSNRFCLSPLGRSTLASRDRRTLVGTEWQRELGKRGFRVVPSASRMHVYQAGKVAGFGEGVDANFGAYYAYARSFGTVAQRLEQGT